MCIGTSAPTPGGFTLSDSRVRNRNDSLGVNSWISRNMGGEYTGFESPKPGSRGSAPTRMLSATPKQQTVIAKNIATGAENIPATTIVPDSDSGTTVPANDTSNAATVRRRTQTRLTGSRRSLLDDENLGQRSLLG